MSALIRSFRKIKGKSSFGLPYVCSTLNHEPVCALVDSGSSISLLDFKWYSKFANICKLPQLKQTSILCRSVNGQRLAVLGTVTINLGIHGLAWPMDFVVVKGLSTVVLLGCDFLLKTQCVLDYSSKTFMFKFLPNKKFSLCTHGSAVQVCNVNSGGSGLKVDHLEYEQACRLVKILDEYPDVLTDRLGVTNKMEYKILLTDQIPVRQSPYRLSPPKMRELRKIINQQLKDGVIRPSVSPYASPVFLVKKPSGQGFRPVVDYRLLNQKVVLESVPLPDLHNCFTWFAGAQYFTVLDLNQAYHQVPLAEESKALTAFTTDWNLYEYNRVPFGLATGAAVLSRLLDSVLGELKYKFVYNYLDDVVIYSKSFEEHLSHVQQVLDKFREAGLTVKPSKVDLARREISFLGHIVSAGGVKVDHERTKSIRQFPPPRNKREVARFIGMINFFRKFLPNFAQMAAPLNQLRRKGESFKWTESHQAAFDNLKQALASAPVLAIPDFEREFVLQTDASNSGLAAVLLQEHEGGRRAIAYASRSLTEAERKYSVYELEALAVMFGLEKFRFYLEHKEFTLETDNQALSWVLARPRKTGRLARWAVRISAFRFKVKHIKGTDNQVADALSRMFQEEDEVTDVEEVEQAWVSGVLSEIPALFQDLGERQEDEPGLAEIRKKIREGVEVPGYSMQKGLLCRRTTGDNREKICLPKQLVSPVFKYFHESVCGGHLGVHKTIMKIKEHLTWPSLYRDVRKLVQGCHECKRSKPNQNARRGELQSSREDHPLDKVFIDYLGPLPRTKEGNRYLLVVVDAFSRFVWLLPSKSTNTQVTIKLLSGIFGVFGSPKVLVSDNAPAFVSKEFKRFCFNSAISHITTIPYYPQPSFAERVNRNLKSALIAFHSSSQTKWDQSVSWINFAFNTAVHESHKTTPARLMFAFQVNSPLSNLWSINDLLPEDNNPEVIKRNWEAARKNIRLAHRRGAIRYNKGRRPTSLRVGQVVYLKNFWAQSKGSEKITGKMLPRFVGPCDVIKIFSPVSCLVRDRNSKREIRAHISQLKVVSSSQNEDGPRGE